MFFKSIFKFPILFRNNGVLLIYRKIAIWLFLDRKLKIQKLIYTKDKTKVSGFFKTDRDVMDLSNKELSKKKQIYKRKNQSFNLFG